MGRRVSPRLRRSHRESQTTTTTTREWTFDGATSTTTKMDNASRFCALRAGASSGGYTTRSPGRSARLCVSAYVSNACFVLLRLFCRVCSFYPKDKERAERKKCRAFSVLHSSVCCASFTEHRNLATTKKISVRVCVCFSCFIPFGAVVLYRVLPLFCPTRVSTPSRRLSPKPQRRSRFQYPLRLLERVYSREITRRRFVRW